MKRIALHGGVVEETVDNQKTRCAGGGIIKIKTFGGFSILDGEKEIPLGFAVTTKMIQLFINILTAGTEGISKRALLERLYGNEELEDSGSSLRVNMHRLRKWMKKLGCFGEDECILLRAGFYYWNWEAVPVLLDTEVFRKNMELAQKEAGSGKAERLLSACRVYQGDFLPELAGEEWVAVACSGYQRQYHDCVKEAGAFLMEEKRYGDALELSEKACQIYPYEDFYLLRIDSLMALGRIKEAMKVYERAAVFYFEELGLPPSEEMVKRFSAMSEKMNYHAPVMDEITQNLMEKKNLAGAYYCSYPSFVDCYHTMSRMLERNGQGAFLMLCTLNGRDGSPLPEGEKLKTYMMELKNAIGEALRKSDFYTRMGNNQFLVLLVGMKQEGKAVMQNRIDQSFWKKVAKGKTLLTYQMYQAME